MKCFGIKSSFNGNDGCFECKESSGCIAMIKLKLFKKEGSKMKAKFSEYSFPHRYDYDTKEFTINQFIEQPHRFSDSMYEEQFTVEEKSRVIESIMLGLPKPTFYAKIEQGTDELIFLKGFRVAEAIMRFLDGSLTLVGMKAIPELEGKTVADFSLSFVRKTKSIIGFRTVVLDYEYDDDLDTYERLSQMIDSE